MHKFIELFKLTGVSKYVGENLLIVQEQVTGVCKRLDSVRALHSEHVMDVLSGLGVGGACTASGLKGGLQGGADRPDSVLMKIEPVGIPGLERVQKEVTFCDLQQQGVAGGLIENVYQCAFEVFTVVVVGAHHNLPTNCNSIFKQDF